VAPAARKRLQDEGFQRAVEELGRGIAHTNLMPR
jgi:hypothetical protein